MSKTNLLYILLVLFIVSCKKDNSKKEDAITGATKWVDSLIYPEESHFKTIRQVTFGGDNAEAYWSFDDKQLIFQSNNKAWNVNCDQMFLMNATDTFDSIIHQ